ncbi:MAG: sigma 54-interacting transcriptional regulator [Acidobacteriota bacterium]
MVLLSLDNIIGTSKRMRELYDVVKRVAQTDVTILLLGESGTGKELLAKAIHHNSIRREKPIVTINYRMQKFNLKAIHYLNMNEHA